MASFYNRRLGASYTPTWNQRIYPRQDPYEHNLGDEERVDPESSSDGGGGGGSSSGATMSLGSASGLTNTRSTRAMSATSTATTTVTRPRAATSRSSHGAFSNERSSHTEGGVGNSATGSEGIGREMPTNTPIVPPPLYFPGQEQLARIRTQQILAAAAASSSSPSSAAAQGGGGGPRQTSNPSLMQSTNTASSYRTQIRWLYHPTISTVWWRRFLILPGRAGYWRRCLFQTKAGNEGWNNGKGEVLWNGWPKEFGGVEDPPATYETSSTSFRSRFKRKKFQRPAGASEEEGDGGTITLNPVISRSTSRRSEPDSGIGLTPQQSSSTSQAKASLHPLEQLFQQRIQTLNETVSAFLIPTRTILCLLEILNIMWFVMLIISLIVTKGRQVGFLEGVEVSLILLILSNGTGITIIRMKRWNLHRQLRNWSRDWSPNPIASSTNYGLMNNFWGSDQVPGSVGMDGEGQVNGIRNDDGESEIEVIPIAQNPSRHTGGGSNRLKDQQQPTLRWSMYRTEGSWWLSYRPVIKVELVTPSGAYGIPGYGPLTLLLPARSIPQPSHIPPPSDGTERMNDDFGGIGVPVVEETDDDAPGYEA